MRTLWWMGIALACLAAWPAQAHRLVTNDGSHSSPEQALAIADVTVSQLVLQDLDSPSTRLWIAFEGQPGQAVFLQLGLPRLDRLESYRPALALVGPGLPPADLPFDVPAGMGATVFEPGDGPPRSFNEHFTGTQSWILLEETATLPQAGTWYVVLYHPDGETGKAWVAVGQREVFGLQDILTFPEVVDTVRTFHEVQDRPRPLLTRVVVRVGRVLRGLVSIFPYPSSTVGSRFWRVLRHKPFVFNPGHFLSGKV